MNNRNLFVIISLCFLILACGSNVDAKKKQFSIKIDNKTSKFKLGETVKASIVNNKNFKIDSVTYFFEDTKLASTADQKLEEKIDTERLGKHLLKAIVYYEGKKEDVYKKLTFYNNKPPKLYKYKIIAEYPHDQNAFTQGLEFVGDTLYESTGKNGLSSLRKVNYTTGEILIKKDIDKKYFAEGITIINDKIYQLTWQSKEGFIYDLKTLEKNGSFTYNKSKEGWGLCNDGKNIYKSDGTEKIWILNPKDLSEKSYIEIATDTKVKSKFNELEWIDGKIYANTWQKDGIAIINPKNGALEAVINLSGLREKVNQHPDLDVLNGIAYKKDTKQLFVTGKNWDKLFEIEIIK
ncbi:glutaminyl-peptide cyclotransferase [Aquimarina litoralis]|uniref:glutaminyl-peptide cyclotransferase n=1 Tax=Aquimarina litoralis TaxID=584605 RepID=UPI001C5945D1|nr:glutaminyl-peptide cyclotransferase [Aquimarina litoralis]MBW1298693.1 glutaminyl-peptide cyclotransferase [Aquimarina litoralis]